MRKKRINVLISDNINAKLDSYSERYGISKSGIVSFVMGQWIDSMDKMNDVMFGNDGVIADTAKKIDNEMK